MTLCVAVMLAGVAACGGGHASGPAATLASAPRTQRTTTTLSVEQQVEAAYLKSWDIYAEAMRTRDTNKLSAAFTAKALELRLGEVAQLKASGTRAQMSVEHDVVSVRLLNSGS
ncbi:MAG: hypothetical protein QOI47_2569, partial [Actinomycetota bacterium]|nr:hypothetical protein [Actinomycetota bacterium]